MITHDLMTPEGEADLELNVLLDDLYLWKPSCSISTQMFCFRLPVMLETRRRSMKANSQTSDMICSASSTVVDREKTRRAASSPPRSSSSPVKLKTRTNNSFMFESSLSHQEHSTVTNTEE
ncbi:hypothetical protein GBF38_005019, partial [Nibea albiflora]